LRALLEAARARRERDWLMLLVTFWHGLRASEVVHLTSESVSDGFLTVQRLKGSLRTVQPLIEHQDPLLDEKKALIDYASKSNPNQPIFPFCRQHLWRLFQKYAAAAGLPAHKRHPHVLKHTIAMQTIKDAGIENVRQYLGHKSISSTGQYLKVSDQDASAAIAKAAKGPKRD
jgi:type 1 fimbriae regulatory protein FimB